MNIDHTVDNVTEDAPRQTSKKDGVGRIAMMAVLVVLLVGMGSISGYYEGHTHGATATVAIPWSIR